MPSPFYGTDAVYGLRALLGTSNISDIDAGFAALRDDVASKMKGAVPRVTSLPTVGPLGSGALVDGQECYLVADATNGVLWHLRYNAASSSAYKWEYVGGPPLHATGSMSGGMTTSFAQGTLPQVTIPSVSGGDFDIEYGGQLIANTGSSGAVVGQYTEVDVALYSSAVQQAGPQLSARSTAFSATVPNSVAASCDTENRLTGLTGGAVLNLRAEMGATTGTGAAGAVNFAYLRVKPVRVG